MVGCLLIRSRWNHRWVGCRLCAAEVGRMEKYSQVKCGARGGGANDGDERGVYFWFISKYLNTLSLTVRHCWLPLSAFVRRLKASVKHAGYASANIARTIYVTHYFLTVVDEVREIRTWVKVWIGLVSVMTSLLRPTVEFVQSLSTTESSVLVSILCFTQTDSHLQLHLMHHTQFLSNQVTLMHTL